MRGQILSLCNRMRELYNNRLTAQRAANLDNLNAPISALQTDVTAWQRIQWLYNQLLAPIQSAKAVSKSMLYDVAGTYTFTVPVDATFLEVTASAGGGGGGGGGEGAYSLGAAGGGGASVVRFPLNVVSGQNLSITVGAGGAAQSGSDIRAGTGGTTSIGSAISLNGGQGGKGGKNSGPAVAISLGNGGAASTYGEMPEIGIFRGTAATSGTVVGKSIAGRLRLDAGNGGSCGNGSGATASAGKAGFVLLQWVG